jgi:biotin transport system substrate-specific component
MQSTASAKPNAARPGSPYLESALQTVPGRIMVCISATVLVAVCAHVTLSLPFTPVPLVLSDFAVILVGLALGPSAAFMAMVLYLAEGAMGLPVFSPQGLGGVAQLMGPTAGYLFAYPFAAAVAGLARKLSNTGLSNFSAAVVTGSFATTIVLASGAGWLGHLYSRNLAATWAMAVAPFLFGAAAKIVAAALMYAPTRRWLRS